MKSQDDIFRGGEYVDQLVVLVDHADLVVECVLRAADRDRLAADQDLAVVGEVDACEHIHQRGLAAAVFAEQGQNLAVIDRQVDPVVGDNRAKTLGDVFNSIAQTVSRLSSFLFRLRTPYNGFIVAYFTIQVNANRTANLQKVCTQSWGKSTKCL